MDDDLAAEVKLEAFKPIGPAGGRRPLPSQSRGRRRSDSDDAPVTSATFP
jgi:hypothetical protein